MANYRDPVTLDNYTLPSLKPVTQTVPTNLYPSDPTRAPNTGISGVVPQTLYPTMPATLPLGRPIGNTNPGVYNPYLGMKPAPIPLWDPLQVPPLNKPVSGGTPPMPVSYPPLGGPLPPTPVSYPPLGGPLPPTPVGPPVVAPPLPDESGGPIRLGDPNSPYGTPVTAPPLGGPLPPTPTSTPISTPPLPRGEDGRVPLDSMGGRDVSGRPVGPTPPTGPGNFGPAQTVNDMINSFINGPYAQNAYRRGVEQAAARGLANSSIAGGQAQRAALEAVQPFVSEGMSLLNQREGRALTQQESQLQRDFQRMMQGDAVAQQNWLANQAYSREFNGNLSMIPIANSMQFMQYLFQAGMNDPEVFTPQVLSGYQNFFQQTMLSMLQQFFPSTPGASILPRSP